MVLISLLSNVSANFYLDHETDILQVFDGHITSPTIEMCRPYIQQVVDGDLASDSGVLFYTSSDEVSRKSYIFPHTLQAYLTCQKNAITDDEKCFCYGNYIHIIRDFYSHSENGFTTNTLERYLGNNYFGHMTVEQKYADIHMNQLKNSNPQLYLKVIEQDKKVLNSLMVINPTTGKLEAGGKYLKLLNAMAQTDMAQSVDNIRRGYLGVGFYETAYAKNVSLPMYPYIVIPAILVILGLLIIIMLLIFGKSKWKWFGILIFLIIFLAGIYIFYSFYTGQSWKAINLVITIPPKFGYLSLSSQTVSDYNILSQKAIDNFFIDPSIANNPNTAIQDASGLTYKDASGVIHQGSLDKAERGYKYFLFPSMVILIMLFVISVMLRAFDVKPKRKLFNWIIKWFSVIGLWVFFGLIILFLISFLL